MTNQEALSKLVEEEGFPSLDDLLQASVLDSISPAICITCGATAEMEPDQDRGYCESCGGNAVKSALILAGLI